MESATGTVTIDAQELAALRGENASLKTHLEQLTRQIEWFKRQLFGSRSERRLIDDARQLSIGELELPEESPPPATTAVAAHTRAKSRTPADEAPLRFDDTVPVEVIEVADPQIEGSDLERISEKVTHRLAQRPGSYVILKYVRRVLKQRDTGTIHCAPAPAGVLERSFADVSFLDGMLIDKFAYHLPLYRQHQRLAESGITVSRHWLTQVTHRTGSLLAPIAAAQSSHTSVPGGSLRSTKPPSRQGAKPKAR